MRQQTKFVFFLASCLLLTAFSGCGNKQTDSSAENSPVNDSSSAISSQTENTPALNAPSNSEKQIVITVDTIEISPEQLKEQDYIVTLKISLEKNAGISYSEWGLSYDDRCEVMADTDGLSYNTVYAFSENKPLLWTAWSGGAQIATSESAILNFSMKLPEDASIGDFYAVNYESMSQANMPHKWSDGTNDWVAMNAVSWNDGGVKVVVSAD